MIVHDTAVVAPGGASAGATTPACNRFRRTIRTKCGDADRADAGCFGWPAYEWRANTIATRKTHVPALARTPLATKALRRAEASSSAFVSGGLLRRCPARHAAGIISKRDRPDRARG